MIGDPVSSLLNLVFLANLTMAFVRAAFGFFIVVDSSTASRVWCPKIKFSVNLTPLDRDWETFKDHGSRDGM